MVLGIHLPEVVHLGEVGMAETAVSAVSAIPLLVYQYFLLYSDILAKPVKTVTRTPPRGGYHLEEVVSLNLLHF